MRAEGVEALLLRAMVVISPEADTKDTKLCTQFMECLSHTVGGSTENSFQLENV